MPVIECGYEDDPFELLQSGARLNVQIGFDPEYRQGKIPKVPNQLLPALIDTGADDCCIDIDLATELELPRITDRRMLSGVGGVQMYDFYLAQIFVPELEMTVYGQFAAVHIRTPYRALIGRTLLSGLIMEYAGPTGKVTIRMPPPLSEL